MKGSGPSPRGEARHADGQFSFFALNVAGQLARSIEALMKDLLRGQECMPLFDQLCFQSTTNESEIPGRPRRFTPMKIVTTCSCRVAPCQLSRSMPPLFLFVADSLRFTNCSRILDRYVYCPKVLMWTLRPCKREVQPKPSSRIANGSKIAWCLLLCVSITSVMRYSTCGCLLRQAIKSTFL